MSKRIGTALSLACVLSSAGCAAHKKDGKDVEVDRGVTDLAPGKAAPASAVPPDPSFVYVPASSSQPKFVPVDAAPPAPTAPVAAAPDPVAGISATPAAYVPAAPAHAPVVTRTPGPGPASSPAGGGKSYLVQKGDTLFRIAKTHYGDGNRWQQIAMVNPGLTPATLKAGATIMVP